MSRLSSLIKKIRIILANDEQYNEILRRDGVCIGKNCVITKDVVFGTEPYLISIGDNVRLTSGVKFFTHDGGFWVLRHLGLMDVRAERFGKISIGDNVNIGWNVIILPGVTIGNNVVIGAGAVVTKDIPDNSVAAGVPAKVIETIEQYSEKNQERIVLTKDMSPDEKKRFLLGMM